MQCLLNQMKQNRHKRYWRNLARFLLATLVLGLAIAAAILSYQGAYFYTHPPRDLASVQRDPADFDTLFVELVLETEDGLRIQAWYTPPENEVVILLAHGYAQSRVAERHALFAHNGFGVLSWDARAHGTSEGEVTTVGYHEVLDVGAALDYVMAQPNVRRVGGYGVSMGGATMIRAAAAHVEIEAVVTDSSYAVLEEVANHIMPFDVLEPSLRWFAEREMGVSLEAMRPVDEIGRLSPRPVFIIHGDADQTVPVEGSRRLYEAAGEPRFLWTASNASHANVQAVYSEEYEKRVIGFFREYLVQR